MAVKKTIVVVGGAHGGPSAAAKARQFNEHARIVMVEQGPFLSCSQPSLKHHLDCDEDALKNRRIEEDRLFGQRFDVEIRRNTRAISIDVDSRCLMVDGRASLARIPYDSLIFAGGALNRSLDVPGLSGPRVVNFRSHEDITAIKTAIKNGAKRALVVGCGLYGIEAAVSLKAHDLDVTVIESSKRIMKKFSLSFAHAMLKKLSDEGIVVKLDVTIVDAVRQANDSFKVTLSNGDAVATDLVVVCIGIAPRTTLLTHAGAAVDIDGLIRVDDHMMTTLPKVFACGSAVNVPVAVTGDRRWLPEPAIVQRTAQVAGFNAAIDDPMAMDVVRPVSGALMVAIGDMSFARTGLSEHEARKFLGDDNIFTTTVFGSATESLVYQQEMCVKLMVDRTTRRIVGGEVFGKSGVERSIDLLSVAVLEGFTPDRLIDIDLAYRADASPSLDPLKDAAMRARMSLMEKTRVMSAETLALWLKSGRDFRLVDVSGSPKLSGHMAKRTIHLPLEALRERMNELTFEDSPIVLYSKSGHRSYLAQQALMQRGVSNVYHLDGGLSTWDLIIAKE